MQRFGVLLCARQHSTSHSEFSKSVCAENYWAAGEMPEPHTLARKTGRNSTKVYMLWMTASTIALCTLSTNKVLHRARSQAHR